MKLQASDIGSEFKVADFEVLEQLATQSLGETGFNSGACHSHTGEYIDSFLESLNRLFHDCSFSRDSLLTDAANSSEDKYAEALQATFNLIDKDPNICLSHAYTSHRFGKLFAVAHKFALYEDGAVDNKPGFFFVMRVAENLNNGGGSYFGYVARMLNYVCGQILEHRDLLQSHALFNQNQTKNSNVLRV